MTGLDRCRSFLEEKDPDTASKAAAVIGERLRQLTEAPETGRFVSRQSDLRECVIPFGRSGYVALYRHLPVEDAVVVLAFRHQREAGYS